ncbi:hypothetical protein M413DRAFT_39798, partial [Hebeloma cylindrosporum]
LAWGGAAEQAAEIAEGKLDAKDWQAEAKKIVKNTMAQYYANRPSARNRPVGNDAPVPGGEAPMSDFDKHRETLISEDAEEGWASELARYLGAMERDVKKDTDIVEWWQNHVQLYPTLARIALDVLPSQASSVPCERMFSGTKQIATDRRSCLGPKPFEELTVMKSAWGPGIYDAASWNSAQVEEVGLVEFEEMLVDD